MKFAITPNGQILTMYSDDKLNKLQRLGDISISRASNVEFNHVSKEWEARDTKSNNLLASHTSRSEALKGEVVAIEKELSKYAL